MRKIESKMAEKLQSTFEFIRNIYLPGYMTLANADYDSKGGTFEFNIREPPVVKGDWVNYFTPRGLHICVSQAGFALAENLVNEGKLEYLDIQSFRNIVLQGKTKITELYQKWRREIGTEEPIQGRFNITKARFGKVPVLKMDFDFGNKSVHGNLTSIITSQPVAQTNQDILII